MSQDLIQHHHSFTDRYEAYEAGISPQHETIIRRAIQSLNLKCLTVYADDFDLIYYGVIHSDGTMIQHSHEIGEIVAYLSEPARIR